MKSHGGRIDAKYEGRTQKLGQLFSRKSREDVAIAALKSELSRGRT
jgi:hypothetical protein